MTTVVTTGSSMPSTIGSSQGTDKRSYRSGYRRARKSLINKLLGKKKSYSNSKSYYAAKMYRNLYNRGTEQNIGRYGSDWANATPEQRLLRSATNFYGKGDYLSYIPRGIGAIAGGFQGALHGWRQGASWSKAHGLGDYRNDISTNAIIENMGQPSPQQGISVNSGNDLSGDVYMNHTEFVTNVSVTSSGVGTSGFSVQTYSLNAGLSSAFPFLSQIAQNFTLYEFEGLIFQYKPTSGEYGSTNSNALGKVIMATNYDPDASSFTSSQQMENYDYASSCKPSCGMLHGVETKPQQRLSNQLYVRVGSTSKDLVLTDLGIFQIATEGIFTGAAGTYVIGELWVTYKIKLSRKNIQNLTTGVSLGCDRFTFGSSVAQFYVPVSTGSSNNIGCTITPIGPLNFRITFPVSINSGTYIVYCTGTPSGAIASAFAPTSAIVNCSTFRPQVDNAVTTQGSWVTPNTNVNTQLSQFFGLKISAPGSLTASIVVNCTVNWGVVASGSYLYVLECSSLAYS